MRFYLICAVLLSSLLSTPLYAKSYALLIGVGQYQSPDIPRLQGPVFDVLALRNVLLRYWGFQPNQIVTLQNWQASKSRIMAELNRLQRVTKPGDSVFVYYSGHGINASALPSNIGLPLDSGAILPFDARIQGARFVDTLLLGSRDLRPHLQRLDAGGRQVFVALDACYSAGGVRAADSQLAVRSPTVWDKAQLLAKPKRMLQETYRHPYEHLFFISAARLNQPARDIGVADLYRHQRLQTLDMRPHGAFTDALLRVLSGQVDAGLDGDGLQYRELYRGIQAQLHRQGLLQEPIRLPTASDDKSRKLNKQPVFAGRPVQTTQVPLATDTSPVLRLDVRKVAKPLREHLLGLAHVQAAGENANLRVLAESPDVWRLTGQQGGLLDSGIKDRQALLNRVQQYAWFHRLRRAEFKRQPFAFTLDLNDAIQGNEFRYGDRLRFKVKADHPFWLLLLYVNAHGELVNLYPYLSSELQQLAANKQHAIPPTEHISRY